MTRVLKLLLIAIVACLLQTEFVRYIRVFTVAPDMIIILLVLMTDDYGVFGSFVAGSLTAFFYNATTGYSPAINLVSYAFIGYMAPFLRDKLDRAWRKYKHKRFIEFFVIVFFLTFIREVIYIGYLFLVGAEQGFVTIFRMAVCVIYTSLLIIPFALIVDLNRLRIARRREEKEKRAEMRRLKIE